MALAGYMNSTWSFASPNVRSLIRSTHGGVRVSVPSTTVQQPGFASLRGFQPDRSLPLKSSTGAPQATCVAGPKAGARTPVHFSGAPSAPSVVPSSVSPTSLPTKWRSLLFVSVLNGHIEGERAVAVANLRDAPHAAELADEATLQFRLLAKLHLHPRRVRTTRALDREVPASQDGFEIRWRRRRLLGPQHHAQRRKEDRDEQQGRTRQASSHDESSARDHIRSSDARASTRLASR